MENKAKVELLKRISELEDKVKKIEEAVFSSPESIDKGIKKRKSVKEFLIEKDPKTVMNKVLVVAVYNEKYLGEETFEASIINDLIRKAKEPQPSNVNVFINKNVSNGYFEEDNSAKKGKKWFVTNSGLEKVDSMGGD